MVGDIVSVTSSATRRLAALRRRVGIAVDPIRRRVRFLRETWQLRARVEPLTAPDNPQLIISLTSFPARIRTVWATIATLLRQTRRPDVIVLVLAENQFPGRRIPHRLRRMEREGLRILWTSEDLRGLKKLLPVRAIFPDSTIITVDDDFLYEPGMVQRLLAAADHLPQTIIGHRGWVVQFGPEGPLPYWAWVKVGKAHAATPSDQVFLTGGAGALYPPMRALDERLLDPDAALRVTPTADDAWFWSASVAAGVPRHCTGDPFGRPNGLEGLSPSLLDVNRHRNDAQIAAAIEHFGLEQWCRDRWLRQVDLSSEP